jgi:hypothetical protein
MGHVEVGLTNEVGKNKQFRIDLFSLKESKQQPPNPLVHPMVFLQLLLFLLVFLLGLDILLFLLELQFLIQLIHQRDQTDHRHDEGNENEV